MAQLEASALLLAPIITAPMKQSTSINDVLPQAGAELEPGQLHMVKVQSAIARAGAPALGPHILPPVMGWAPRCSTYHQLATTGATSEKALNYMRSTAH